MDANIFDTISGAVTSEVFAVWFLIGARDRVKNICVHFDPLLKLLKEMQKRCKSAAPLQLSYSALAVFYDLIIYHYEDFVKPFL